MTSVYVSKGFTIHVSHQTIERDGTLTNVRPKTFALLLLFLERPQEVLSKRYLLDTIWDDAVVDEPVLVQSIRELRQLFGCPHIIQTYPRKGYAWPESVQKKLEASEPNIIVPTTHVTNPRVTRHRLVVGAIASFALVIILLSFFAVIHFRGQSMPTTEVVVVLPVKNEMLGGSYNWITLGAMDQLIHLLQADNKAQIMQAEYVLQLIKYARFSRGDSNLNISRVFEVSGASLVVEARVSGSVDDYRLDYKLHRKKDIKLGVIFDSNLESGLQKLGGVVGEYSGVTVDSAITLSENAFHNELMARALEKMDSGEFQLAINLLESLKQLEPNNIVARQLLARSLLQVKRFDAAKDEINVALALDNQKERDRLYYLLAEIHVQQGMLNMALETLDIAAIAAQSISDTLYLGYIAQLRAAIYQEGKSFLLAEASYEQAIKYFGRIRCPIGLSIAHLQMADLFIKQGDKTSAQTNYFTAKELIENHKLYPLDTMLAQTKDLIL